ncbi:MAG TPA: fibronectin type III domain-containing protein [Candidatus Angelobacter sp.]|nr:fibronectin type III domain-containing protein [Candidatus Angelobacter sp.]
MTILALLFGLTNAVAQGAPPTANNTLLDTGFTLPYGAQVLAGSAINPATGRPFRHLWTADTTFGLCRLDPDLDSGGPFTVNSATCITTVAGTAFTPGRLANDPLTNTLYSVNNGAKASNVARYHFLPDGDSGQGLMSTTAEFLGDAGGCGLGGNFPWALALGPDGNLYIVFKLNGNIVRVVAPSSTAVPCSNVQVMGSTADARRGLAIAWIGHDLWGSDVRGPFTIANADQCFTPANGNTPCHGTTVLKTLLTNQIALISDQVYPATNGDSLYMTPAGNNIFKLSGLSSPNGNITLDNNWANGFLFLISLAFDNSPSGPVVYAGDDPGQEAGVAGGGRYYAVSTAPVAPTIPGVPVGVTASAGDSQAFVTWLSGGGTAATSYTVRNASASNGILVPDVAVPVVGSSLTPAVSIGGLVNGVTYTFIVSATNAQGTSAFSAPSNPVTPIAITVPGAPTSANATASDSQATVSWIPPASNGNATITSYTVTADINGVATGITAKTPNGNTTSAVVTSLTDGTTYTFTVHATNSKGNGPESAPSNAVTPTRPLGATDMSIGITGPASINVGGNAVYTLTASNLGPSFAPQVTVVDFIPAGATFSSGTPSQGACVLLGSQFQCNLGSIVSGGSATVTVTLNVTAAITNTATVNANDANGNPVSDPAPANNTFSLNTALAQPPTTTDLQVTGSPQNGGPTSGPTTTDTITWQVKNAQNQPANAVVFTATLPTGLPFNSVSTNIGTCTAPAVGSGGTIVCNASTIANGTTMIVTVNFSVPGAGTLSSTGNVSFNGTDTNSQNDKFTVTLNAR